MATKYILHIFVLCLVTVIVLFVVWQVLASRRAQAKLSREDEYRGLSARTVVAQEATERRLDEIATHLAETRNLLESIQRTLTVVE